MKAGDFNNNVRLSILYCMFCIVLLGCSIKYSFTGASIAPDVKTIQIDYFTNKAPLVYPTLSQTFTDDLIARFRNQTTLNIVSSNGDLVIQGSIVDYATTPIALSQNQAEMMRLTIKVEVKYTNTKNPKEDFTTTFSRYADYNASQDFNSVQSALITIIAEQLIDDIFNKTVVNW